MPQQAKEVNVELQDALEQISQIRQHLAKTEVFRGYRSATALFTSFLAILAAIIQSLCLAKPSVEFNTYALIWGGVAILSIAVTAFEMTIRYFKTTSPLHREATLQAVEQMLPALFAGALVTIVLGHFAHETVWIMPGLWNVLFGLGILSSRRVFPKMTVWVGRYYLLAGVICLSIGNFSALSPWTMGVSFGLGQLLVAIVLYYNLERHHAPQ